MWASLEIAKLITSFLIPLVIVILGYYFNRRLKQIDQNNEDRHHRELEAKEQERDGLERRYVLRIEFSLDATIIGVQNGFYLLEFTTTIDNKSLVQKKFTAITLRVLGIKKDENIGLWTTTVNHKEINTKRINFPEKILKETIIPAKWNYIFVEPGVKQKITYTTPILEDITYILATVEFHYDASTPHTAEKMLALQAPRSTDMTNEI